MPLAGRDLTAQPAPIKQRYATTAVNNFVGIYQERMEEPKFVNQSLSVYIRRRDRHSNVTKQRAASAAAQLQVRHLHTCTGVPKLSDDFHLNQEFP